MPSDHDTLLDMGFDPERVALAVKKSGGLQGALEWLEENQDKSIEEINAASKPADDDETNPSIEPAPLKEGEAARSMVCNECGKKFRSMAQVEFHASKTDHSDFAESTEEIKPLTEEEKKKALAELREKAAARKAAQALVDKEEQKKNEKIRMKATREAQDIKEELAKNEQIKAAARKRQEKLEDIAAKKRIQDKIAADKEARRLKAEKEKAEREGRAPPADPSIAAAQQAQDTASAAAPAAKREVTETRLRLQTAEGNIMKAFGVETTLFEVAEAVRLEKGISPESFTTTYPKKTYAGVDFGQTLKEAGLTPSAVLIVK